MKTAVVFADDNGKLLSERHVKIKCACDQYVTSALVVATLAQRLLRLEANEVERNEDTVLYRLQTSRTPEPDVTPEHHLRIRRFLNESQLRLKL